MHASRAAAPCVAVSPRLSWAGSSPALFSRVSSGGRGPRAPFTAPRPFLGRTPRAELSLAGLVPRGGVGEHGEHAGQVLLPGCSGPCAGWAPPTTAGYAVRRGPAGCGWVGGLGPRHLHAGDGRGTRDRRTSQSLSTDVLGRRGQAPTHAGHFEPKWGWGWALWARVGVWRRLAAHAHDHAPRDAGSSEPRAGHATIWSGCGARPFQFRRVCHDRAHAVHA